MTGRGDPEDPHCESGDLVVDCLLLRHLPSCVSSTRQDIQIATYLIVTENISEFLNESRHLFGILALIYETTRDAFRQQCL